MYTAPVPSLGPAWGNNHNQHDSHQSNVCTSRCEFFFLCKNFCTYNTERINVLNNNNKKNLKHMKNNTNFNQGANIYSSAIALMNFDSLLQWYGSSILFCILVKAVLWSNSNKIHIHAQTHSLKGKGQLHHTSEWKNSNNTTRVL